MTLALLLFSCPVPNKTPAFLIPLIAQNAKFKIQKPKKHSYAAEKCYIPGSLPSLKLGLGFIPASTKPLAGTKPSGDDRMQMVPPVIMIKTRPSGYWVAILTM
jgi:hypothetical protein